MRSKPLFPSILTILSALLATAEPAAAQSQFALFGRQQTAFPETMLLPILIDRSNAPVGWILSHRNRQSGGETPDHELQSRTLFNTSQPLESDIVSWEILRTRNDRCYVEGNSPCPDLIRVSKVPKGFVAVPQQAWVAEGETQKIYIVPAGVS